MLIIGKKVDMHGGIPFGPSMLLGIWLKAEDRRKHYGLELPNIKK